MVDLKRIQLIIQEYQRRLKERTFDYSNSTFSQQESFINDPAKLKALKTTRRAGKSYSSGLYIYKTAIENPLTNVLYLSLTRDSAKRIMFRDILLKIARDYDIKCKPNHTDLTIELANGSMIYLLGVDSKPNDMDKVLGQKFKLVIIDEAAFFRNDLNRLVYEILMPTVADEDGTIALISTTSNITNSLYYNITTGKTKGWSVHEWTTFDNPFMEKAWKRQIEALISANPDIVKTPMYRRMYLNEWVIDSSLRVYRFDETDMIETIPDNRYRYVLGVDLGFNDESAFVLLAYSRNDQHLYGVTCYKASGMDITEVAERIKYYMGQYDLSTIVVDGSSKQAVEEIKRRFNIPLISTDKTDKRGFIEILNSEFTLHHIKLHGEQMKPLIDEMKALVWDERQVVFNQYVEAPSLPNHLCDAFLYGWRWCYHYAFESLPERKIETNDTVEAWFEKIENTFGRLKKKWKY